MIFKPHALHHIIAALSAQNILLGKARNNFLSLKAEKDHFEATLIKEAPGESNAEKTMLAKANESWMTFHKALNRFEAEYEFIKFQLKILEMEYFAQKQELDLNGSLIKKEQ